MKEDCRKQVIEAKVLPYIVTAMSHPSVGVRAAACQCTRSLSRSMKNLRTSLVDAGIEAPLFQVQTSVFDLCNLFHPNENDFFFSGLTYFSINLATERRRSRCLEFSDGNPLQHCVGRITDEEDHHGARNRR